MKSTYSTSVPPKWISYNHVLLNKSTNIITLKYDTGSTVNYIRGKYNIILKNPKSKTTGLWVRLPDKSIIQLTLSGHLTLTKLPSAATQAHVYQNIKIASLLSIGKLCDSGCSALFTKIKFTIFNSDNNHVLNGIRGIYDGLWCVTLTPSQPESSPTAPKTPNGNSILWLDKTKSELASYLHAVPGFLKINVHSGNK